MTATENNLDFWEQEEICRLILQQGIEEEVAKNFITDFEFASSAYDIHATGPNGETLAEHMQMLGYPKLAQKFVEMGLRLDPAKVAELEDKTSGIIAFRVLREACEKSQDKDQFIIQTSGKGVSLLAKGAKGETVLHCAMALGKDWLATYLIKYCAKLTLSLQDNYGKTPLDYYKNPELLF